jgi:hypothetical protein
MRAFYAAAEPTAESASGYLIPGLFIAGVAYVWWSKRSTGPRGGEIRSMRRRGPFDAWWATSSIRKGPGGIRRITRLIENEGHGEPLIDSEYSIYGPYRTIRKAIKDNQTDDRLLTIENQRFRRTAPRDWTPRVIPGERSRESAVDGFAGFGESIRYKSRKKGKGYFTSVCSGDTCIGGAGKTKDRSVASAMRALAREFGR